MLARERWGEEQAGLDPSRLVFIDETGASTKMARRHGRAKRGERCRAAIPHGHWKTTTFTAGLRIDGVMAPLVLDGPMYGAAFLAYTSLSWIICPPIKYPAYARQSKRREQRSSTSRHTRRTSTLSKWPSPNSRPCFARPPPELSRISGKPSHKASTCSPPPNAKTSLKQPGMAEIKLNLL